MTMSHQRPFAWLLAPLCVLVMTACVGDIEKPGGSSTSGPGGGTGTSGASLRAFGPPQARLLSAAEYRNTVRDLLGLEATPGLTHADLGSGYDTGAGGKLDENLFSALLDEAERLSIEYIATRIETDYPCFDPSNVTDACITDIIEHLGRRAYRRPLAPEQRSSLLALFQRIVTETSDRGLAAQSLVTRLLASARFLHRTEIGAANKQGSNSTLDQFERASLISYALTGSMPDEALFQDAEAGLLEGERIRTHVQRLLNTDAGRARFVQILQQWLRLSDLDAMVAEPEAFPKLSGAPLALGLRNEFSAYVSDVIFDGPGTLRALLTANHTFVNQHTAPLYGATESGDAMVRLSLDASQRKGVLGLASVMAVHASVGETSKDRPVIRGLLIKNQLLCEEVGLPSGIDTATAAANVATESADFEALTTREQFETMMNQGQECKNCHQQFMPYGFLMGNFDALGQFQTKKGDLPINTAVADIAIGERTDSYAGLTDFVDELAQSDVVSACFTRNLVAYAVGSATGKHVDAMTVALAKSFGGSGGDIQQLLADLLSNPDLYVKRWDP